MGYAEVSRSKVQRSVHAHVRGEIHRCLGLLSPEQAAAFNLIWPMGWDEGEHAQALLERLYFILNEKG